jgi:hypothetical protein
MVDAGKSSKRSPCACDAIRSDSPLRVTAVDESSAGAVHASVGELATLRIAFLKNDT